MDTLKTIRLGGVLGRKFGREFSLAVNSVAEASRALCAIIPGFEKFLMESKDKGLHYAVIHNRRSLKREELESAALFDGDELTIMPILAGSKKGGVLNIIVGAVLVIVGALIQIFVFDGAPNPISNYFYGAGISMIVGGIVQLLTPVPKMSDGQKKDDVSSYMMNGPVNVTVQGASVPVLYGELDVGSVVVSAGISVKDNYVTSRGGGYVGGGEYRSGGAFNGTVHTQAL